MVLPKATQMAGEGAWLVLGCQTLRSWLTLLCYFKAARGHVNFMKLQRVWRTGQKSVCFLLWQALWAPNGKDFLKYILVQAHRTIFLLI